MEGNTKVHILKMPDVTDLAGEKVMIDFESGKYFMLTGSANDIWDRIKEDVTVDQIVAELLDIYQIDEEECRRGTMEFMSRLVEIGFIEWKK